MVNKKLITLFVLAAMLEASPLAKASSDTFNFTFTDGKVSGTGTLSGSYVSSGVWQITSGTGTFNNGVDSGAISLVTNPNGPENLSLSLSGYFGYDDLLNLWSGPNQILDEAGLLFRINSMELNLWQGGIGPGAGEWADNLGDGDQTGTFAITSYNIQQAPLTISGTAVMVIPGATTGNSSTITVTPAVGFTGNVALTAVITSSPTGAQYLPTLSFGSTTPVNLTSTSTGTATLTIITTAASSGCSSEYRKQKAVPWYAPGSAVLACVLLLGIPARRRRWMAGIWMLALLAALSGGVFACGGGGGGGGGGGCTVSNNPGTTAGTYTITVTGTSGTITATKTITLTVQ
jgi:hypothetical protein